MMSFLDEYMATLFSGPECEDLHWLSMRRNEIYSRAFHGEHSNGVRLAYEAETDAGALDAGEWNRQPQYAVSYDE